MKQHIEWIKDNLEIHVQMTLGEAFAISVCLIGIIALIATCLVNLI